MTEKCKKTEKMEFWKIKCKVNLMDFIWVKCKMIKQKWKISYLDNLLTYIPWFTTGYIKVSKNGKSKSF